ncbi:MAG TPA: tyrosine--tRNA ligase [Synergistales bacterium]|nr:tyrosine--tRNA ligase [Synergistales bacterium]
MFSDALHVLKERGHVEWCSNEEELHSLFTSEMVTAYVGFDPTADSLHVGHLIPIMALAWIQRCGHRPIPLAGVGTGLIGDPSGKSKERNLLTIEKVQENVIGVKKQLARFLDFDCGGASAQIINNYDWLGKLTFLDVLREVGKHFSVNSMVSREYVKSRLDDPEKSISYTEFSYVLLQAYDFLHLFQNYGCRLQMGGNDQQGNIISGIDLIRKKTGGEAFGATQPLLLTSSGTKFGKTEEGAVWLDPQKTSPYKFYQFWMNTEDQAVEKLLKLFTFLSLEEIEEIMQVHRSAPERREAQRRLAWEVTGIVHGQDNAATTKKASGILFGESFEPRELSLSMLDTLAAEVPSGTVSRVFPALLTDILAEAGACSSKSEVRRLLKGGGLSVNGVKVTEEDASVSEDGILAGKYLFVRLGKKRFFMILFQ